MKKGWALILTLVLATLMLPTALAADEDTAEEHISGDWTYVLQADRTACITDWEGEKPNSPSPKRWMACR